MAQLTLPPLPGPNKPAAPEPTAWPRSAQLTAAFLLGIVLTLLIVQGLSQLRPGNRPADLETVGVVYRIDLNRASRAELLQIPGFGPQLVERIESHRRDHGPFHSVDDLLEVQGFGPTTVQRVRPWVCVTQEVEAAPEAVATPAVKARPAADKAAHASAKKEGPAGPLDPNRATFEELQRLPGIGPKMAQRIVDERARKAFRSVDELRRVSGIGAKTLEKLRPYFQIDEPASQITTMNADR